MADTVRADARKDLASLSDFYRPQLPPTSRWEDEQDRWHELAFAAIAETSGLSIGRLTKSCQRFDEPEPSLMNALLDAAKSDDIVAQLTRSPKHLE
jgi:hypothetical protein